MKIGIDLDDVLAKSMIELANFHNETYGTNFTIKDIKSNSFDNWGGTKEIAVG